MFKNRAVQVTLAKNDAKTPNEQRKVDRDQVLFWNALVTANLQNMGGGLVLLYGLKKTIDTGSEILIKLTPTR